MRSVEYVYFCFFIFFYLVFSVPLMRVIRSNSYDDNEFQSTGYNGPTPVRTPGNLSREYVIRIM